MNHHSNNNEQDHHAPPSVKGSGASLRTCLLISPTINFKAPTSISSVVKPF